MKRLTTLFAAIFLLFSCTQTSEKLLLGGSGWDRIVIIDKASKQIEWEYPLEEGWECNSVDADKAGNILFSFSKGARLITPDKKIKWNIPAPEGCEMQTAKVLPDGRYLLAWCGSPATILEIDAKGAIVSTTTFDTQIQNPHSQFRQINKTEKGNYLVPLFGSSDLWEVTPSGTVLKRIKMERGPFSTAGLPNGNYLVACGDSHSYVELNLETEEIVRKVSANDIEGITLGFVAQIVPTRDGGLYLCNWQGHGSASAQENPQLIQLDSTGKISWSLNDKATFGLISTVQAFNK